MSGYKTWIGAALVALSAGLEAAGMSEWAKIVLTVGGAIGLIGLGLLAQRGSTRLINVAGFLILAGTLIFSGCLYLLVLTDIGILGAVVAIGGTLQIAGWVMFAAAAYFGDEPTKKQ